MGRKRPRSKAGRRTGLGGSIPFPFVNNAISNMAPKVVAISRQCVPVTVNDILYMYAADNNIYM